MTVAMVLALVVGGHLGHHFGVTDDKTVAMCGSVLVATSLFLCAMEGGFIDNL